MSDVRTPDWASIIRDAVSGRLEEVHVSAPARVERYDSAKQLVDVQLLIKRHHEDEEGNDVVVEPPVIPNVPVVFPGGGGFVVQFPIDVGDTVLVVFCADPTDKWLQSGAVVDPDEQRRFSLVDAFAIPGLRSFGGTSGPRQQQPSGHILIGRDGQPSEPAALGQTLKALLDAFMNVYDNHTHTFTDSGGDTGTTVTPLPTTILPPNPPLAADVRSGTVKVTT